MKLNKQTAFGEYNFASLLAAWLELEMKAATSQDKNKPQMNFMKLEEVEWN